MLIYGWNSKNIKQAPLESYVCPSCAEKKSHLAVFSHYVHIFWIPLFPYKKSAQIFCGHCQLATEEKGMEDEMKDKIKLLKSSVSTPKYLFSGLLLLAIGIAYLSFSSIRDKEVEEAYIDGPQAGDVYILKDPEEESEYDHYMMKVDEVDGDSLIVMFNYFRYNGAVEALDPEDGFYDITYIMHKDAVSEYQGSGQLVKVIRDYSSESGFDRMIEYESVDSLIVE